MTQRSLLVVAAGLAFALAGCGGSESNVDRALLYGFPDEADRTVEAAGQIRAQAEKDGGDCERAAVKLYSAAQSFETADMATDPDIINGQSLQENIEDRSEAFAAVQDAVKATQAACPAG